MACMVESSHFEHASGTFSEATSFYSVVVLDRYRLVNVRFFMIGAYST